MSDPYTSIWCNYTENSTNVANNTSNITVSLICSSSGWADDSPNYWLKVNGSTVRSGTYNFGNGTFTLCSWTGDVPHNADGTGTVTYQGYFQGTAKPDPGNTTGVYSQTLTTISRASTLDNGTTARRIDQNMTFTVTKKIDAATNKLTVRHRTSTGLSTVNTNYTSGGNISFNATTLTSIMALNTTGTSVSMQVVLETIYSNSTVGTSSAYFNGTFAAPAPTWTAGLTVSPTQNVVANHSTITIKCANAPSFKAGTSLSSVIYTIGSKSASSTNYSSAVTFTGVSTNTVTVKITDKRNATYTTSINNAFGILDYVEPTFNITSIGRYPDANNTGAQIQFAGTKVSYQAATVSGYYTNIATGVSTTISSGYITTSGAGTGSTSFTGAVTIPAGAFAIESVYNINLSVSDGYETKSASGSISKVSVLMDLDLSNNRVGIGQLVPLATSGSDGLVSGGLIVSGKIKEEGEYLEDKYAGYEVVSTLPSGMNYSEFFNLIYPVGSIYLSINSTNPSTLFGGTWVQIAEGQTLWSAGTNNTAGTHIDAGLPNITGAITGTSTYGGTLGYDPAFTGAFSDTTKKGTAAWSGSHDGAYNLDFKASNSNSIYGNSNTVQPPAFCVYMWRRTA